jgi:cytochrome c553
VRWPERAAALALACAAAVVDAAPQVPDDPIVCMGCHGRAGEGRPQAGYPPLAGQPPLYLRRQLEAYADGRRTSRVMTPIAQGLPAAARERLATHFAHRPLPSRAPVERKSGVTGGRGERLAEVGDEAIRVQACANCHGRGGAGQLPTGPRLAGLPASYIAEELRAWREGRRRSDPSGAMEVVAQQLLEADIEALAAYYSR